MEQAADYQETRNTKLTEALSQAHYENAQLNTTLADLKTMEQAADYQETKNKKLTEDLSQAKYDIYLLKQKLKKAGID